ncbi:GNAT family N-acetyltransferase [Lacrimispora amygdalina]|uniref:GNAT family N-acetyltransferase n=1 Tax=Lacrimispora amygdalina TaxID=253257 RepID=A0A3E2NA38_9FIRM|nr:GNAT family N-acetyltransferase [Clostridium indicum]RFZ77879.1 GNAT family N-acetyltransferase [Clostridium indicum]
MERNVMIRKSVYQDIPQLVQLRMEFLKKDQGEEAVNKYPELNAKTEEFINRYLNKNLDIFIAEVNGELIAVLCVFYLELLPRLVSKDSKCAHMSFVYIKPQYKDEELEKSLYENSMKHAKEKGAEVFEINVLEKDIPMYESAGFIDSGYPPIQLLLGNNTWGDWSHALEKGINMRKADSMDIPQLIDLRVQYLCEVSDIKTVKNRTDFETRVKTYFDEHLNKDLCAFVAEINGAVISVYFMIYFDQIPEPGLINGKIGVPINRYTKPQYRCDGLSEALFVYAAKDAENCGVELLEMEVPKDSIPFYEKFGFEPMKTIPVQISL